MSDSLAKRLSRAMNQGKQAVIGKTTRSFLRRTHLIEILNPADLGLLVIKHCVLLCDITDNPQKFMSCYLKKYVPQDDSRAYDAP